MSKFKALSLGVVLSVMAGYTSAHSNHAHMAPITQDAAAERADQVVQTLLTKQQLENSWANAKATETKAQTSGQGKVWVVHYSNPSASDATKQDLYIILDEMGNPITANHDGQL